MPLLQFERLIMKVQALIKKLYGAVINHDNNKEKKIWKKILKKSLKHKNTHSVR